MLNKQLIISLPNMIISFKLKYSKSDDFKILSYGNFMSTQYRLSINIFIDSSLVGKRAAKKWDNALGAGCALSIIKIEHFLSIMLNAFSTFVALPFVSAETSTEKMCFGIKIMYTKRVLKRTLPQLIQREY
ncbi:CLUMA_CG013610, isoform A [Clunio marinus]|uniref:CLUMA_CG013610, isoform A n=1 Tax=Clunio marinus TaxID=568069 RepID=A0A1J1IPB6_9DIPT|nr:CLUMA_CG013610, isoform A [Clunio marinus]